MVLRGDENIIEKDYTGCQLKSDCTKNKIHLQTVRDREKERDKERHRHREKHRNKEMDSTE